MRINTTILDSETQTRADLEIFQDAGTLFIEQQHSDGSNSAVAAICIQDGQLRIVAWSADDPDSNHTHVHGHADPV